MTKPKYLIFDVDGVLTDGKFYYSADGKVMKAFGVHDTDALKLIREHFEIRFITADDKGLEITSRRVITDMGYPLTFVPPGSRKTVIEHYANDGGVVFMADSFTDVPAMEAATFSIAPANAHPAAKSEAWAVTRADGGSGAVAEACQIIAMRYGIPFQ